MKQLTSEIYCSWCSGVNFNLRKRLLAVLFSPMSNNETITKIVSQDNISYLTTKDLKDITEKNGKNVNEFKQHSHGSR